MTTEEKEFNVQCPVPLGKGETILLGHGSGGKLTHELIRDIFVSAFTNPLLESEHDSAVLPFSGKKIAFTTDSFVVQPLFFPGGDIGDLAVNGTVNDLAMAGARPLYMSVGFILEEGLPRKSLQRVVGSMKRAARAAGISLVTGDTKVVDRGKADSIFINTAGIGVIEHALMINPAAVKEGDAVIVSGDIARHGMAVMAVREGLSFEGTIESDTAPLAACVGKLLDAGIEVHCLRDLTRGGLATAMVEIAEASGMRIDLDESAVPVSGPVQGACEILGLDPFYVANEGRMAVFVASGDREHALALLRECPEGKDAALIGSVRKSDRGFVTLRSQIGVRRVMDRLSGEQLPRIC